MVAFGVAPILSPLEGVFANTVYYNTSDVTGQVTITVGNCALIAETTYYHREGMVETLGLDFPLERYHAALYYTLIHSSFSE